MFNWPLRFFLEAYLEICFGSWMKWLKDDFSYATKTDAIDSVLAWFYFVLSGLIPFVLVVVLTFWESTIKNKGSLYERLESIFSDISLKTWYSINFVTFFLLRRFSLVMIVFFCVEENSVF
jgi:hypothetical protein